MKKFWQNYSLAIVLAGLFLVSWLFQGVFQYVEVMQQAMQHGEPFKVMEFWIEFGSATMENWQSEFLQLLTFVVASRWFRFKGSHESKPVDAPNEETG